jgi:trk system potassium uptake protein TrkA
MKILICGGKSEANFVISSFLSRENRLVVINEDPETAKFLSEQHGIDVQVSDPTKAYSFDEAGIEGFDLVISLLAKDVDNFVVCRLCKEAYHVKKAICTVNNPTKVAAFKMMGIDSPLSASYLLAERIQGESDVDSLINTLSLENKKIIITEIKMKKGFSCLNKTLRDLSMPKEGSVCCIFRNPDVIIPRGETIIREGDTLVLVSPASAQKRIIDFLRG